MEDVCEVFLVKGIWFIWDIGCVVYMYFVDILGVLFEFYGLYFIEKLWLMFGWLIWFCLYWCDEYLFGLFGLVGYFLVVCDFDVVV